jgi:hypothetical protein
MLVELISFAFKNIGGKQEYFTVLLIEVIKFGVGMLSMGNRDV